MGITSYIFVFAFLPVALSGWILLNKIKKYSIADIFLLLASVIFIGSYDYRFVLLLLATVLVNFTGVQLMNSLYEIMHRKIVMIILVAFNLGILVFLKYGNWIRSLLINDVKVWKWILPIGISFYTLEQICFIVDSYRGNRSNYSLTEYVLFSMYFPVILSGPILRHDEFIEQIRDKRRRNISENNIGEGLISFCLGMGKKVIIASWLGHIAALGFDNLQETESYTLAISIMAYSLQIYFDFSGYCDIVEGVSIMFGFQLPINFNSPYHALSIEEFWKRWHLTLTGFLTRYVYIPLGGNRKGKVRQYINIFIVFLVSGIWHGTSFTFILWGMMHGCCMVVNKMAGRLWENFPGLIRQIITFVLVALMWIPFRVETIRDTYEVYRILLFGDKGISAELGKMTLPVISYILEQCNVLSATWLNYIQIIVTIVIMILLFLIVFFGKNVQEIRQRGNYKTYFAVLCSVILFAAIIQFSEIGTFIYEGF